MAGLCAGGIMGKPSQQEMQDGNIQEISESEQAAIDKAERRKDKEAIVQGLAMGRVIWREGDCCGNLRFFIKNNDAVFAIFFCHEMHPYNRCNRLIVKICGMAANFGMACLFLDFESCKETRHEGVVTGLELDTVTCEQSQSDAVAVASFTCGLCVSVILFIMYWFYTCRCARKGGPLHCGKKSEDCWVCCTKPITGSMCLMCLGICAAGLIAHGASGVSFADSYIPQVWLMAEAYSVFMGLGITVFIYFSLYCGCECCPCLMCLARECWGSGQGSGARPSFAYPHGDEYPKDKEAFWRGDRSCGTYGHQGTAAAAEPPTA